VRTWPFSSFFLVEEAPAQQGCAQSRRLHPDRAARPATAISLESMVAIIHHGFDDVTTYFDWLDHAFNRRDSAYGAKSI
jgi:hypothetical protein